MRLQELAWVHRDAHGGRFGDGGLGNTCEVCRAVVTGWCWYTGQLPAVMFVGRTLGSHRCVQ